MRRRIALALLLVASPAAAQLIPPNQGSGQTAVGLPAKSFAFFRCFCNTSPGAPLPSQLTFVPQPVRQWNGNVYATSSSEATSKAQTVCSTERRGSLFDCINCRCDR